MSRKKTQRQQKVMCASQKKTCARCEKIVYPTEELKCLDKVSVKNSSCFVDLNSRFLADDTQDLAQRLSEVLRLWNNIEFEQRQRI